MSENTQINTIDGILEGYSVSNQNDTPNENELEVVNLLLAKFEDAKKAKASFESDIEFFRCYLKGDQLLAKNRLTNEIIRLSEEDSKRLRSQSNVLRPTARSLIGKLTRVIPTCVVLPATSDFNEQHGARVATALLAYFRRKENLDVKYIQANEYLIWAGNAILQLTWDRFGGRKLGVCHVCNYTVPNEDMIGNPCPQCSAQKEQELAMLDQRRMEIDQLQADHLARMQMAYPETSIGFEHLPEELQQEPEMEQQGPLGLDQEIPILQKSFEGDIRVVIRDPRQFFVEPGAESIESANWVCLRTILPVYEARRNFPEMAEFIHSESISLNDKTGYYSNGVFNTSSSAVELNDHCYIYEFHEKPTEANEKGRIVFIVNNRVVRLDNESPYYKLGRFPFYQFKFDHNCGEFWGESFIAQAWHRQRELNRIETQIREHIELALKPKLLVPVQSYISDDEITAYSNQIIKYNPLAGKIDVLQWPNLNTEVFQRKIELAEDIRVQANVTASEMGSSNADPNGRAMAIIEAEADQQMGPILVRNHTEWRELHRGMIILFREFGGQDRVWSIVGNEGVQTFSFEELVLQDGWDIQVEQDDGLSRNPAVRFRQALELLNAGVFTDPQTGVPDLKSFMRHAKLNMPNQGYDIESCARAAASQIPYLLQKGMQHRPMPEDNPTIFAEELYGWLVGPGRKLSFENPMLVEQVRALWQYYVGWATLGSPPQVPQQQNQPGPGNGGSDMTAQGGTPNNVGGLPTKAVQQVASTQIQNADSSGERLARQASKHES